jgi:hypothetical protein
MKKNNKKPLKISAMKDSWTCAASAEASPAVKVKVQEEER